MPASRKVIRLFFVLVGSAFAVAGCGYTRPPAPAMRSYQGTASVGDFVTISIDSTTKTITYDDVTSSITGTVSYTTDSDGSYAITDPQNNLLTAYEVPGYVLLVEAAKAGPTADTPALITAFETTPAAISSFSGSNYNYIQFRTTAGGINVGTVSIDAQGDIQHSSYSPMALIWGNNQYFDVGTFDASAITEDPSGNFFTITEQDSSHDIVFGTQNGLWAVDTNNGSILGLPKAASKAFDPSFAGSYNTLYYEKIGAQVNNSGQESGNPTQGQGTVTISASGDITIKDSQGSTLATGTLVAVADAPYLYNGTPSELPDPCWGLFTVRTQTASSLQDVFLSFQGNAVLFGSFQSALPAANSNPYTYLCGVGLK